MGELAAIPHGVIGREIGNMMLLIWGQGERATPARTRMLWDGQGDGQGVGAGGRAGGQAGGGGRGTFRALVDLTRARLDTVLSIFRRKSRYTAERQKAERTRWHKSRDFKGTVVITP